jgi:hypothetical protein
LNQLSATPVAKKKLSSPWVFSFKRRGLFQISAMILLPEFG